MDWKWQFRQGLKSLEGYRDYFDLSDEEVAGFAGLDKLFRAQVTPYYASLASRSVVEDPIRKMIVPHQAELTSEYQQMLDPLGENKKDNRPCRRLIHRYSDRVLFLFTDLCSVYCRYCTRKHFTGHNHVVANSEEIDEALSYIKSHTGIREVIFSGGDPLTVSNSKLEKVISAIYDISHVEIIRMGTRMPVVCPMRIDDELISIFQKYKPIYLMTHFNHPKELTLDAALSIEKLVDHGVPVFNQMVLLSGINNHEAIVQALSRRLLFLRAKPYYMFQADPSLGTDHLRTSIEDSLEIQRKLWGHISGLAMPTYIVDIPGGGGKAAMVPDFQVAQQDNTRSFKGWDGHQADYISPERVLKPFDVEDYLEEWDKIRSAKR